MKKDLLEEIKTEHPELSELIESVKKVDTSSEEEIIKELEHNKLLLLKIKTNDKKNSENK